MLSPNTFLQNRYLIIRELARGGQGAVYEATDLTGGVAVAVKESLVSAAQVQLRKAFEREALLLKKLRHPALPLMMDYFARDEEQFLVMEFIAGHDLSGLLDGRLQNKLGPFPLDQVLRWADQLLDALEYLHAQPIIHRDIKPQNLKPAPRGQLMLLDFGLAKGAVTHMSHPGRSIRGYTPQYAPLEQINGEGTDVRSDLYSVAATLHHLLTGQHPPTALARAAEIARKKPDPLKSVTALNVLLPAEVAAVIYRALAQDPDDRPATAKEMRQALRAWNQTPPQPIPTPSTVLYEPTTVVRPRPQPPPPIIVQHKDEPPAPPPKPHRVLAAPPIPTFEFETVTLDAQGKITARRKLQARYFADDLGNGVKLEMVEIPGGTCTMGTPDNEAGRSNDEGPQHRVTVPPFWLGKFAVTQAQWQAVMGNNPARFKGDGKLPVENVSWDDAQGFLQKLNARSKLQGKGYRLPSEAEWEYACRAGTTTPFAFGATITPEIVNYNGNYSYANASKGEYRQKTVPVGSLGVANAFGLYDMHGSVWEWCEDEWHNNYDGAPSDGRAWADISSAGSDRVDRGGGWSILAVYCRSANRSRVAPGYRNDNLGFRLVRT